MSVPALRASHSLRRCPTTLICHPPPGPCWLEQPNLLPHPAPHTEARPPGWATEDHLSGRSSNKRPPPLSVRAVPASGKDGERAGFPHMASVQAPDHPQVPQGLSAFRAHRRPGAEGARAANLDLFHHGCAPVQEPLRAPEQQS